MKLSITISAGVAGELQELGDEILEDRAWMFEQSERRVKHACMDVIVR